MSKIPPNSSAEPPTWHLRPASGGEWADERPGLGPRGAQRIAVHNWGSACSTVASRSQLVGCVRAAAAASAALTVCSGCAEVRRCAQRAVVDRYIGLAAGAVYVH